MRKLAQRGKELAQSFTGDNQWNLSLVYNKDFLPSNDVAFLTTFSCLRPACLEAPNVSASSRKLSLTALSPGQSDYTSKTYIPIRPV